MKYMVIVFIAGAFAFFVERANAASQASCVVSLAQADGTSTEVIRTPNLPPFKSFQMDTCRFASADGKIVLRTTVLRGLLSASIYHENKKIFSTITGLHPQKRQNLNGVGVLPSGEEVSVDCSAIIDPRDALEGIRCS